MNQVRLGRLHKTKMLSFLLVFVLGKSLSMPIRGEQPSGEKSSPVRLWDVSLAVPKSNELRSLQNTKFHVIKPYEFQRDGYRFLHGVALVWHAGKLYASFGHNQGSENSHTEEARWCVSHDGGITWSEVRDICRGKSVSHGVFLSHENKLWAFHGTCPNFPTEVYTKAFLFNPQEESWEDLGRVIGDGFWPMQEPQRMADGNWIMAGLRCGNGHPPAVAISRGDDFKHWDLVVIPSPSQAELWGESTVIVHGQQLTLISRYGAKATALVSRSNDYGRSWTELVESNLPMATSKPYAGMLSNGQRYLISTTTSDSGKRRSPLTIAISEPGQDCFSRIYQIRAAEFRQSVVESHPNAALAYPYAVEQDGKLYVGYSNSGGNVGRIGEGKQLWNNNSAEMAIIDISELLK